MFALPLLIIWHCEEVKGWPLLLEAAWLLANEMFMWDRPGIVRHEISIAGMHLIPSNNSTVVK